MTSRAVLFLLLGMVLGFVHGLSAEEPLSGSLRFDHLSVEDGLSSSSVSEIIQDEEGLLWFATQSGLNRYDGYSIEHYQNDPFDANSLSHNLIQTMYLDATGIFWIGTYGGLNRFDPENETFTRYAHDEADPRSLSNNVVVAIARDADGCLWAGTLSGLNRLESESGGFTRYMPDDSDPSSLPSKVVRCALTDSSGTLWIGTYGGLSRYEPERDGFYTYSTAEDSPAQLPSSYVMEVIEDSRNSDILWVGTWEGGVSALNTRTEEIRTYELPHNEIYTMMFDSAGRLWVGTWGSGLYIVDPETGDYRTIRAGNAARPEKGLAHDVVYSLAEDQSGIVWIGTNGGGVNSYVPHENRFDTYRNDPEDPASIAAGKIESIQVDPDGTVWYGVYDGGLSRFDPDTKSFTRYTHDPDDPSSLSNDIVNAVYRDSRGNLWVGTNEGLNRYLPAEDAFERIYAGDDESSLPEDVVFEIAEGPDGDLWLGTNTAGVAVYDYESERYRVFQQEPGNPESLSDNLIGAIHHDSRGNTWVGTNHGLNRYHRDTHTFTRYFHHRDDPSSLSSNKIRAIHEDANGRLWIATAGGGVNRYDYDTDSFSFYSTKDGLSSNHVLNIVGGGDGTLWFSTNRGISVLDPQNETFRTLKRANGLVSNELTNGACRGPNGTLYFGSVDGVTVIDESFRDEQRYTPPVVVTDVEVLGNPRSLDRGADGSYEPLELDHGENYFTVEFSALDYASPSQNRYSYRLEGFDEEWIRAGNRHFASYTNLDPGHYELEIRGAGSRGNWNRSGVTLPIVVSPPWWGTNYAYIAYAAVGLLLLFGVERRLEQRRRRAEERLAEQRRINEELDRKVRDRTAEIERSRALAERANREKSRFLANMSHEIRTPLNGLIGMLSLLSQSSLADQEKEYVRYSKVSAENLNTLVNDLLDFERIEAGELRLSAAPFSLSEVAQYVDHLFREAAESKGLVLSVSTDIDDGSDRVVGDRGRLAQVLTNLTSNAVKYTESGRVDVRVSTTDEHYLLEVKDTGKGIPKDEVTRIFHRFRQLDDGYTKTARGVGLGLAIVQQVVHAMGGTVSVDSTPGEGSLFRVQLPLEPAADGSAETGLRSGAASGAAAKRVRSTATGEPEVAAASDGEVRLLVCEDEAINRLYLVNRLKHRGYTVDVAADGEEAFRKAVEDSYGAVLMDLGMPKISGLEATRRIRSWEEEHGREQVPVIALTAHTYEEDIRKTREAGMNDFISKPISEVHLARALSAWVE